MLSINADAKTVKGKKKGILTGILYLAPVEQAGVINVCPFASKGCAAACLYSAGRGRFTNVQQARINKTTLLCDDRAEFFRRLIRAIRALVKKAAREGLTPAVRLNGTSDLPWEAMKIPGSDETIIDMFPDVQFYDYTKWPKRALNHARGAMPGNYHLTFSRSETNQADCKRVLQAGGNVAVVFERVPARWSGVETVDGDESDVRFLDPAGVVVALTAKGDAKKDQSGFVVRAA